MLFRSEYTLCALIAFSTILSIGKTCKDQCTYDVFGSTFLAEPRKLRRVFLRKVDHQLIVPLPIICPNMKAVKARACAKDIAPFVSVNSFKEVVVQRRGAPNSSVHVDITVYCPFKPWGIRN